MNTLNAKFHCSSCQATYQLDESVYDCKSCGGLLEVIHDQNAIKQRSADSWRTLFESRHYGSPGPYGSGVWRYHEWVLPEVARDDIVTMGEGGTPLTLAKRLGDSLGLQILVKQCGHSITGSFKDLGMTVLISQLASMRRRGIKVPAVACASTGDTSAALAAYGAAAGLRTLVLLPRGKITAAQMVQPLSSGAHVIAIDTDFDGCMKHVQRLCNEEGVYLANSKNSLRIEGQKTVAFEIVQALGWQVPDWVAIPGGNLGNVSALVAGFSQLLEAGLITHLPKVLCAQAEQANPLFRSYKEGFSPLIPLIAGVTQASAIRIGNPVSFPRAVRALKQVDGVVESVSETELTDIARRADESGLYVCPHTAVALGAVEKQQQAGVIAKGARVVVVATAHGLKFTEFKIATAADQVAGVNLGVERKPCEVPDDYAAVLKAALG
ncbi:MAG: threonine synthase [Deltaproteobacteria bacterium]|nr:threonine synthase [Deltaproteobacteria bacterium]